MEIGLEKLAVFGILSLPIVILSWRPLIHFKSHGFYRFFSWECILWLIIANVKYWFNDPFSILQLFSWLLLFISVYLIVAGVIQLKKVGKHNRDRNENGLYQFEKTSELVETGVYKYIRHPLYGSLLFLTWGIMLKQVTVSSFLISLISTLFLFLTAIVDEKECLEYFGEKYRAYMKRTKRFIPFII